MELHIIRNGKLPGKNQGMFDGPQKFQRDGTHFSGRGKAYMQPVFVFNEHFAKKTC